MKLEHNIRRQSHSDLWTLAVRIKDSKTVAPNWKGKGHEIARRRRVSDNSTNFYRNLPLAELRETVRSLREGPGQSVRNPYVGV